MSLTDQFCLFQGREVARYIQNIIIFEKRNHIENEIEFEITNKNKVIPYMKYRVT